MCTGLCRGRRYSRRQLGRGVVGASMAGALMASPWGRSARAMQDSAAVTWWTEPDDLEFKQALVGLVRRYDTLKRSDRPATQLLAELDDIRQQATSQASEVPISVMDYATGLDLEPKYATGLDIPKAPTCGNGDTDVDPRAGT